MDEQLDKQNKSLQVCLTKSLEVLKSTFQRVFPGSKAWIGAGLGIFTLGICALLVMSFEIFRPAGWPYFMAVVVLMPLVVLLGVGIVVGLGKLLVKLPAFFLIFMGTGLALTLIGFQVLNLTGLIIGGAVILLGAPIGAGISVLIRRSYKSLSPAKKALTISGLVFGVLGLVSAVIWLVQPFRNAASPILTTEPINLESLAESVSDPSQPGEYSVKTLTYGSGIDLRRPEFSDEASIITESVNGSVFVSNWTELRTAIWGFNASELPLNGRVWYPAGEGPFPLVLVVHGNHLAEDYSDPGYGYLCELLASRGSICVSVDENFLNGSGVGNLISFKKLSGENDLRGWLLLEHLSLWRDLTRNPESVFYDQVDLEQIALIGHSRGGEAVVVAALFNNLPYYPDNAIVKFNYGFNIRSLVTIAPVDGQYQPAGEPIQLTDINYLVIQGSHDMDLVSFDGMNTYERVKFTGIEPYFKSAIYIYGANHGQFNTVWGDKDLGYPLIWLFDRSELIPSEDQMQVARVAVSAFMEVTLNGNAAYLPFFQNVQVGMEWLPENRYLNAYADSEMVYFATYEEDLDVTTGTGEGIRILTRNLTTWKEDHLTTKEGEMDNNGVVMLGWDRASEGMSYALIFPNAGFDASDADQLVFSAAQAEASGDAENQAELLDFSIELVDMTGEKAALPLSSVSPLQSQWHAKIHRLTLFLDESTSEPFMQTYLFALDDFLKVNPGLDLESLAQVRLVFNLSEAGKIWLDNIGFRVIGK